MIRISQVLIGMALAIGIFFLGADSRSPVKGQPQEVVAQTKCCADAAKDKDVAKQKLIDDLLAQIPPAFKLPDAKADVKPDANPMPAGPKIPIAKHARGRVAPKNEAEMIAKSWASHEHKLKALRNRVVPASFDCRAQGWVPPAWDQGQCGSCFPRGTKIRLADGSEKNIEDFKGGEDVLSAEGNVRRVSARMWRPVSEKLWHLRAGGNEVLATAEHPIRTVGGFVAISKLSTASTIACGSGNWKQADIVEECSAAFTGRVFDLEVAVDHSYIANGICVHNCWDFSGCMVCTCAFIKAGLAKNDGSFGLSPQYVLDCGQNGGCNGDDNSTVMAQCKNTGLVTTQAYGAYQAQSGNCKSIQGMQVYKITDWGYCGSTSGVTAIQDVKNAMLQYGPIGSGVAAGSDWDGYQAGQTITGTSSNIDHDITIIGWDDNRDNGDGSKGAYLVLNSWGAGWGDKGTCWIKYGADSIGWTALWGVVGNPPVPAIPAITSQITLSVVVGSPVSYQITATNSPTTFGATGLPAGLSVTTDGMISGTVTSAGVTTCTISAANAAGSGSATLTITASTTPPPPNPATCVPAANTMMIYLPDGSSFLVTGTYSFAPVPINGLDLTKLDPIDGASLKAAYQEMLQRTKKPNKEMQKLP